MYIIDEIAHICVLVSPEGPFWLTDGHLVLRPHMAYSVPTNPSVSPSVHKDTSLVGLCGLFAESDHIWPLEGIFLRVFFFFSNVCTSHNVKTKDAIHLKV